MSHVYPCRISLVGILLYARAHMCNVSGVGMQLNMRTHKCADHRGVAHGCSKLLDSWCMSCLVFLWRKGWGELHTETKAHRL